MKRLMAIFAHPDDEGVVSGTLARYAQEGVEVMLVCATRGEAGEISDPKLATRETLGQVREEELRTACEALGIDELRFLNWRDSGMAGTPENEDPRALIQADPEAVEAQLLELLGTFQPTVVITFEPYGWYGHPDHMAVSKLATTVFKRQYEKGTEHGWWRPGALFHAAFPVSQFEAVINEAIAQGMIDEAPFAQMPKDEAKKAEATVTHKIQISEQIEKKETAMLAHKTQFGEDNFFRKLPEEMNRRIWTHEQFIQVLPGPADTANERADDLFTLL